MILPREGDADSAQPPVEGLSGSDTYTVQLDRFEGPLDLLLYLIQRDEIDIYDIPISHITEYYLKFIEDIEKLNLENAGDFLVMASTLMRIKARLLLPVQRSDDDEEDEDPRDELVRRLLEYKKFKEAAGSLAEAEDNRRQYFTRQQDYPFKDQIPEDPPEFSLSMFDLLSSVRSILDQLKGDHLHHVYQDVFTVEEQTRKLMNLLADGGGSVRFEEVFANQTVKMEVVVTFIAMLELVKQARLRARQVGPYREIWLYTPEQDDTAAGGQEAEHAS